MVDFLERIDLIMNSFENLSEFIAFLKNEAETCLLAEICAMVGLDEQNKIIYQQMQNRSKIQMDIL